MSDPAAIREMCEATLRANWREGVRRSDGLPFSYTCPSPRHYPWQWYWDSCFAAIVWRRFDAERSRRELETLLSVEDNGPGVLEAIRDRIFFPLVSGREGGSGLGLTIAQTFIAQHNGTIECVSAPGHTAFTILLPLEFSRVGA